MQVVLTVTHGPARTRSVRLRTGETILGRSRDCDICVPSPEISRRHCLLAWSGSKLTVEDLSSANGTYLNDQRVKATQPVKSGDKLRLGPITFAIAFQETRSAIQALNASVEAAPSGQPAKKHEVIDVIPLTPDSKVEKTTSAAPPPAPPKPTEAAAEAAAENVDDLGDTRMQLPQGKDFYDLLSQMEE